MSKTKGERLFYPFLNPFMEGLMAKYVKNLARGGTARQNFFP